MAFYVDTSAAVKLVITEVGSRAMLRWANEHGDGLLSSDLLRTELLRAVRRGGPDQMQRARRVLDSLTLVTVPTSMFERAGELDIEGLRSLDAVHLAVALDLGDDLDGIVTYDERLGDVARSFGVTVIAPS